MASNVTDYGESVFAGALFGTTVSPPATYYVGLLTVAPSVYDDGTTVSEPPGASGYARVSVANTSSNFTAASGGLVFNSVSISFPLATADWPAVSHYGLFTAATAGSMYLYSALQLPRVIQSGHLATFDPGFLAFSVSGIRQQIVSFA